MANPFLGGERKRRRFPLYVRLNTNLSTWSLRQTHGYYRGSAFLELGEAVERGGRWSSASTPLHAVKSNTSSEMINRPELFLDSSLPQKKGNICFDSHHTPLYEYDFSHDFLCACVKERVEIKNKTNKDQTKSTCP